MAFISNIYIFMKKTLNIVIFSILFMGSVYGEKAKYDASDKFVKDYFKLMTVADIMSMDSRALQNITTNDNGIQYHFLMNMNEVSGPVSVICFVDIESTICRVP